MSPQLYPTPPHPTDPNSPNNDDNKDTSSQNQNKSHSRPSPASPATQSFVSRWRWPLFLSSYLALGGLLTLPSVQQRLRLQQPRTASLVRGTMLGLAIVGGLGLSLSELYDDRRQREQMTMHQQVIQSSVSVLPDQNGEKMFDNNENVGFDHSATQTHQMSDVELMEKRKQIEQSGLQRD